MCQTQKYDKKGKLLNLDVKFQIVAAVHLSHQSKKDISAIFHICVVFIDKSKVYIYVLCLISNVMFCD